MLKSVSSILFWLCATVTPITASADMFEKRSEWIDRQLSSIHELIPDLDDLDCQPRCRGANSSCQSFTDFDSCLDKGSSRGCFWVCE